MVPWALPDDLRNRQNFSATSSTVMVRRACSSRSCLALALRTLMGTNTPRAISDLAIDSAAFASVMVRYWPMDCCLPWKYTRARYSPLGVRFTPGGSFFVFRGESPLAVFFFAMRLV